MQQSGAKTHDLARLTPIEGAAYTTTVAPGGSPGVFVRIAGERIPSAKRTEVIDMMPAENPGSAELVNDTRLNIAALLMENVGSTRDLDLALISLPLDDELVARDVLGNLRLTRLQSGILASGKLTGHVELECARCLNLYDQPFSKRLTEQFRQTVDVFSGIGVTPQRDEPEENDDEEPGFEINDIHEIDLTELLRQNILLALPMRPDCGDICPGPPEIDNGPESEVDSRFAALQQLLDNE